MSSSLKEKHSRDSGARGDSAKAGGRGRARGAAVERMDAKAPPGRRGAHGAEGWQGGIVVFTACGPWGVCGHRGRRLHPALPVTPPGTASSERWVCGNPERRQPGSLGRAR